MSRRSRTAPDTNGLVAALLQDLAAVQTSTQSRWGYKRAASTIQNLEVPIESHLQPDGTLARIPNIGPASSRVILEALRSGRSETVDRAVAASGRADDIEARRRWRGHFLSRAQVAAALRDTTGPGPRIDDYRGDLQMHSTWSDGGQTTADIIAAAIARGYQFSAVTDHSYGLPIAGGISMDDVRVQHAEIDALNRRYAGGFRLLKGIEANIRADGSVDLANDELPAFEIVVAAPHSALRSPADQTARMIRAVSTPGLHILGHPRGRMYGRRPGVTADWDAVFEAAAHAGVAVEIDGDPSRQDIDYTLARRAVACGCLFALDSDAHATDQLRYAENAIAHARLAHVPSDRVINCWPLDRLLEWAESRTGRPPATTSSQPSRLQASPPVPTFAD